MDGFPVNSSDAIDRACKLPRARIAIAPNYAFRGIYPLYASIGMIVLCRGFGLIYSLSYNPYMKSPRAKSSLLRTDDDPLTRFAGPAETVAASVPRSLTAAIRARVGKREFSRFVGRALARELVDQNRAAYVASFEKDNGPIDPKLLARLETLFAR
jgi:hypothetical protein